MFFICDNHDPNDLEFEMFPEHCIRGTEESEIIPELAQVGGEIIPKKRYSGFFGTDLDQRLAELRPEKVIVCGVCTDICVMHTAADARNRDYPVEIPVDCVATFDPEATRTRCNTWRRYWVRNWYTIRPREPASFRGLGDPHPTPKVLPT